MAYDGNGNFNRLHNWSQDAANGIDINSSEMDAEDNGFAAGLSLAVTRDGQGKMNTDFLPSVDNTLNLGSSTLRWASINGFPTSALPSLGQTTAEAAAGITPTAYQYAPGNVLRYGADPSGVTDSSAAFLNAAQCGAGMMLLPVGTYKISNTVTIDISKVAMIGQNAIVTSGLAAAGNLFQLISTQGTEAVTKSGISGVEFIGTGLAGVICFDLNQTSGGYVAGFSFRNCTFTAFATFVQFRNNAFEVNFDGCTFSQQSGTVGGIYVPSGDTNYGERLCFKGCAMFNNALCFNIQSNTATLFCSDSSFDYSNQVITLSTGSALFSHCYFENNLDTAYWYQTTADGTILFDACYMSQTGAKPNYNWASSAGSNIGSISIRNSVLYANGSWSLTNDVMVSTAPFLVALGSGFGFAFGSNNRMIGFNPTSIGWAGIGQSSGLQPTINTGLPGFTIGSDGTGGNPIVASGTGPSGSNGIQFQVAVAGQDQYAYSTFIALPGDNVGCTFQAKTNNVAAPFACLIYALDLAGVIVGSLGGSLYAGTAGLNYWNGSSSQLPTTFGKVFRILYANLPAQTNTVRIYFITNGATVTSSQIIIGNLGFFRY